MKKMITAVIMLASAAGASAEDIKVDFDGKKGAGHELSALLEQAVAGGNFAVASSPAPAKADPAAVVPLRDVRINVAMKAGGEVKKEVLICDARSGELSVSACRKQSDMSRLTAKDVAAMSLFRQFLVEKPGFAAMLGQEKHSYTNQSGPQTFECKDTCGNWTLVEWSVGYPPQAQFKWECTEYTHECECVAGCY